MSDHYYTRKPAADHDRKEHAATIRNVTLKFVTDAGVFSKSGIDFGSRLLIETLDLEGKTNLLDAGCGYGPIGLFAAKMYPQAQVTMIDINERAVQLAQENAAMNRIDNVEVLQSDLLERLEGRVFDAIMTNPPIRAGKDVVYALFEQALEHLNENGELWVVIQKKQGAPSALKKLESLFSEVQELNRKKGYRIYRAKRMAAGPF